MSYGINRCPEQDSNLHASQHSHLKRARLPFRHLGKVSYPREWVAVCGCKVREFFLFCQIFWVKSFYFFVWVVVRRWEKVVCRRGSSGRLGGEVVVMDERA